MPNYYASMVDPDLGELVRMRSKSKLGLYAEARIAGTVIVWASEPSPGLLWWVLRAYCAAAMQMGMTELTIFYRARKIRGGIIAPMDLA